MSLLLLFAGHVSSVPMELFEMSLVKYQIGQASITLRFRFWDKYQDDIDSAEIDDWGTQSYLKAVTNAGIEIDISSGVGFVGGGWYEVTTSEAALRNAESFILVATISNAFPASVLLPVSAIGSRDASLVAATAGSGPRTIDVTVTNGTVPLEGAWVTFSKPGTSHNWRTGVNGLVRFNLTDATWDVAIACDGHTFAGATLVVNASTLNPTYAMTPIAIASSPAGTVTGFTKAYDHLGQPQPGVSVSCTLTALPNNSDGILANGSVQTVTSQANGLAEFIGLFPGATYQIRRGNRPGKKVQIPYNATSPHELDSIIGD